MPKIQYLFRAGDEHWSAIARSEAVRLIKKTIEKSPVCRHMSPELRAIVLSEMLASSKHTGRVIDLKPLRGREHEAWQIRVRYAVPTRKPKERVHAKRQN